MITRIEIDGFKSFRDFALDLPPLLGIIGTNASGKSNLLDALRFLSAVVEGGDLYDGVDAVRGGTSPARQPEDYFLRLAENISIHELRKVPAFQQWWADMINALDELGYGYG